MALKATIYKVELQISDMDRHNYQTYSLTLARHPSETDERMMLRLVVFALNADDRLEFTKGISSEDEPDIWLKSMTGEIDLWIELGQPDLKRIRRACGRAQRVLIYPYAERSVDIWWRQNSGSFDRFKKLNVIHLSKNADTTLTDLLQRNMTLTCTIQEGQIWLSDGLRDVTLQVVNLQ